MKNVHIVALLGGAATLAYFATRGGKAYAAPRQTVGPTATDRFGAPITHAPMYRLREASPGVAGGCINSRGDLVDMKYCVGGNEQLEGYFPTSNYVSSGSSETTPCCSGCAHGRGCQG